jgi:hypothetical protein
MLGITTGGKESRYYDGDSTLVNIYMFPWKSIIFKSFKREPTEKEAAIQLHSLALTFAFIPHLYLNS